MVSGRRVKAVKEYTLNFGPQHPAAHGVLRLVLWVSGEVVRKADVQIGLLHRGTEKLMESKTYKQGLPYMDRLDYVSMMSQEHTYVLCIESIGSVSISLRSSYIRVMLLEVTRVLNHLLAVSCHALDVGAMTGYFIGFEERERWMEVYERVSGARMHSSFIRVGGIGMDIPLGLLEDILLLSRSSSERLDEMEELLTENRIWKERLCGIGVVGYSEALYRGYSGVMLRGSGVCWDVRCNIGYECYNEVGVGVVVGVNGDSYDRYKVRVEEMRESLRIISVVVEKLCNGRVGGNSKVNWKGSMEGMIEHFKSSSGHKLCVGSRYVGTEAPKGEFGVFISSRGESKPWRVKMRSPGLAHLSGLEELVSGHSIADVVTVIGTLDVVFGEVDR